MLYVSPRFVMRFGGLPGVEIEDSTQLIIPALDDDQMPVVPAPE
jgi:hypothetical protein